MTSALENNTLVEYFQYVQRDFDGQLPIKKGVLGPGFHDNVFVANENTFISADGQQLQSSDTNCVWLNRDAVFEQAKIRCADITPTIVHPLNAEVLHDFNFKAQPRSNTHHGSWCNPMFPFRDGSRMFWPLPHSSGLWGSGDGKVYYASSWLIIIQLR